MEEVFKDMREDRFKNQLALEKPVYGILTLGIIKTSEDKFEALKKEVVRARFDYDESSCTPDGILITNLSRADVQYFAEHFGNRDFIYGERTLSEITGYYQLDDFMVRHYSSFSDSFSNVLNSASRNTFQKYSWKEPRQFLREVETSILPSITNIQALPSGATVQECCISLRPGNLKTAQVTLTTRCGLRTRLKINVLIILLMFGVRGEPVCDTKFFFFSIFE